MKHYVRIIAAFTVLLLALGAEVAYANPNQSTISVTPNTELSGGQTVQVSGSGFMRNLDLVIVECGPVESRPYQGGWHTAVCTNYTVR